MKWMFKHKFAVDIYAMAREGCSDKVIAKQLGVGAPTLCGWKKKHASVRYAFKKARKERKINENTDWQAYIRGRLSPKLLKLWDKITMFDHDENGYAQIEAMLESRGKRTRQQLLIYAFLQSGFNISKALRKVAIPQSTFDNWRENDPEFIELLGEVKLAKKDFFEEALIRLVRSGDSPATILANKTLNKDRGYGEHTEVHVSGNVGFLPIPIHELDLPLEVQRMILEALHNREKVKALPPGESVIDLPKKHVESVEVLKR
jgi:hypothetical protein